MKAMRTRHVLGWNFVNIPHLIPFFIHFAPSPGECSSKSHDAFLTPIAVILALGNNLIKAIAMMTAWAFENHQLLDEDLNNPATAIWRNASTHCSVIGISFHSFSESDRVQCTRWFARLSTGKLPPQSCSCAELTVCSMKSYSPIPLYQKKKQIV